MKTNEPKCLICGKQPRNGMEDDICDACWRCPKCGRHHGGGSCGWVMEGRQIVGGVAHVFVCTVCGYREVAKKAIRAMRRDHKRRMSK